jgi:2'-hydroxyisoflavone reductase
MNILIIGGTQFLGRCLIEFALTNGHKVTMFNRGKSNPNLFPNIEFIQGDRVSDLNKLKKKTWNVVIDTCGYFPKDIAKSAKYLKDNVESYIFISSCSVYDITNVSSLIDENFKIVSRPDNYDSDNRTYDHYGYNKFLCEREVINFFKEKAVIIRPGLIVGPHDQTYRFPYWPERVSKGGETLTPGKPEAPIQIIDVRDLAGWIIKLCENKHYGTFNATSKVMTFDELLQNIKETLQSDNSFTWIHEDFLLEHKIKPWLGIPLWLSENDHGMFMVKNSKALKYGLVCSPLEKTILETFEWSKAYDGDGFRDQALSQTKETKLLSSWKSVNN